MSAALGATLRRMPTNRARFTITGDDEVEEIVERRSRSYPELSVSKLLALLVKKGDEAIDRDQHNDAAREDCRRTAARRLAARFAAPDGFDRAALSEASELWLHR